MKKATGILLLAALLAALLSVPAAAETDLTGYAIANGTVQAARFEDLTAPCSGTLLPFDLRVGDTVAPGETLFEMMTARIAAPEDGTVRHVFVQPGDSADAAVASNGSALALEPKHLERMHASYRNASNEEDCLHVHVGQPLWFRYGEEKGTGIVLSTAGHSYEVEILTGDFEVDKTVSLYKDESRDYKSKVGEGVVYKRDDIAVMASGIVCAVPVAAGGRVQKGDTLLELLGPDADFGASPAVKAEAAGVVTAVAAASGQQVWKGQLLARVARLDALEIAADVDEMDLNGLRVGDALPVTLDTDAGTVLTGTVTEISGLGITRQNAAYYTVRLTVDREGLMLGQSASVYLPKN